MNNDLALDLRLSRTHAGLSGKDLAHLLGCTPERVSRLENNKARISAEEIVALSLIYGQAPSDWLSHLTQCIAGELKERLSNMVEESANWSQWHDARLDTLNGLAHRLRSLNNTEHAT